MAHNLFAYNQALDIRWYAGEPTELPGLDAYRAAHQAGERVSIEGNRFISWMKTSTSDGVCYALCAYWLALNARGEDFWAWLGAGQRAAPQSGRVNPVAGDVVVKIRDMMRAQKQGIEKTGSLGRLLEMSEFLKTNSTLKNCRKRLSNQMPISGTGTFFFIGIDGQVRGTDKVFAHAVAARLNDAGVILFDPNHGDIQTSGLEELNTYLTDYCGSRTGYNIELTQFLYTAMT
ncbi:YopT-type cysteine protease domain-containing protein [Humitalea sp. 24SJ18S-53]|uniref:YopT-type cysteine protease domain-containing protein n=1 Tax=Humitalea sp. 24SJ18S-53 TaxID=3422307 RepID=UPI003D672621